MGTLRASIRVACIRVLSQNCHAPPSHLDALTLVTLVLQPHRTDLLTSSIDERHGSAGIASNISDASRAGTYCFRTSGRDRTSSRNGANSFHFCEEKFITNRYHNILLTLQSNRVHMGLCGLHKSAKFLYGWPLT